MATRDKVLTGLTLVSNIRFSPSIGWATFQTGVLCSSFDTPVTGQHTRVYRFTIFQQDQEVSQDVVLRAIAAMRVEICGKRRRSGSGEGVTVLDNVRGTHMRTNSAMNRCTRRRSWRRDRGRIKCLSCELQSLVHSHDPHLPARITTRAG